MTLPIDDMQSIDELFGAAMAEREDAAWGAVAALHYRGSKEVLDRALALTRDTEPAVRERGADIIGQLGIPDRTFPADCFLAGLRLLQDDVTQVQAAAIIALQHINQARAASHILPFATDPDEGIRYAVAFALGGVDTSEAHMALLSLMNDRDGDVRNWATFGIGQQSDADDGRIRAALAQRLDDADPDVRYEAIIGLGRRRDLRALPFLKTMVHDDPDDVFARGASIKLLGLQDSHEISTSDLLGGLQRLQRWRERRHGGRT